MSASLVAFLIGFGSAAASAGEDEGLAVPRTPVDPAARTQILDRPRWVRHIVTPRERITQLAVRYGVTVENIAKWNELPNNHAPLRKGTVLRIQARRVPPTRQRIEVTAREGDTFGTLAAEHRVEYRDLLAYNWNLDEVTAGSAVTIWLDPEFPPRTVNVRPGGEPAGPIVVPPGAESVGRPQKGRVLGAIQLPVTDLYTIREPAIAWTTSHTAAILVQAFTDFRQRTGYEGQVVISSISRPRGGKFPPHKSHQSGRDVDIRLPLLPGVRGLGTHADEVDWSAAWELVRSLADTGEVLAIYLEISLQRRMFQAALWEGMTPEELRPYLQWPATGGQAGAIVRHEEGHDGHVHVRFRCGPAEPRCRGN